MNDLMGVFVIFIKKNGKLDEDKDVIVEKFRIDVPNEKGELTWKILLTRPAFWVFTVFYVILAVYMLTPIAGA